MKYFITIGALFLCAILIYVLAGRIDKYWKRYKNNMDLLCISCENTSQLRVIQNAIDYCSATIPRIDSSVSTVHGKTIIRKLQHGTIDLVLMSEQNALALHEKNPFLRVSRLEDANSVYIDYLVLNDTEGDEKFYLLWNHSIFSESRERFLLSVKNNFHLLTCGYCEY